MTVTVQSLILRAGGAVALSKRLGVARTTVLDWRRTGLIPGSRVAQIAVAFNIPADQLLPIVQGPRSSSRQSAAHDEPIECAA